MKNIIIKFLGGYTRDEFDAFGLKCDARIESLQEQSYRYHCLCEGKDAEIRRLTNLMLTRGGFIAPEVVSETKPSHQPINNRKPWALMQKELERQDARKQADETERRWKEKQATQGSTGTEEYERIPDADFIAS